MQVPSAIPSDRTAAPETDAVYRRQAWEFLLAGGGIFSMLDYSFTVGAGQYSHTMNQTVAVYSKSDASIPLFRLYPEDLAHKLWDSLVAHKDVRFDSHPAFSKIYQLGGAEEVRVRQLFTPALLSFLESVDGKKKWRIEGNGQVLIIYRLGKRCKAGHLKTFLEETSALAAQFLGLGSCR